MLGDTGQTPDFIVSGLTREEHQGLWEMPQGLGFFEYLSGLKAPLRVSNIAGHLSALGMPEFSPPVPASSLLVAPMRQKGIGVGTIYLAHEDEGREFTQEDEETLVMFAAQAAQVIANAGRHRRSSVPRPAWRRWSTPRRWAWGSSTQLRALPGPSTGRPCASWTACGARASRRWTC